MTDKIRLTETLQALREEIKKLNTDDHRKQSLTTLADQIEQHVDDASNSKDQGIVESLEAAITEFEVEHPDLTAIINRLLVTLSNMGI